MGVVGLSLVFLTVGKGGLWDLLLDRVDLVPFELWDVSSPHNGRGGIPCNRELFSLFICCSDAWLFSAAASSAARSSSTLLRLCLALFGGKGGGRRAGLAPRFSAALSKLAPATAPTIYLSSCDEVLST